MFNRKAKHVDDMERMERIWRLERIVFALAADSMWEGENAGCNPDKYNDRLREDVLDLRQDLMDDLGLDLALNLKREDKF